VVGGLNVVTHPRIDSLVISEIDCRLDFSPSETIESGLI
jgi:hypothetical protein